MIFDKKKLKTPEYTAVLAGFFGGVLLHLYGLVTTLQNADNIHCQSTGYGAGISSGRWMLMILGEWCRDNMLLYNLDWVNGLVFIAAVAISAGFLVSIFRIKSRQFAALIGIVLVSFPTVCSTMLYRYTIGYYGLAFFLSVFAVWILPRYKIVGFLISSLAIACSLGIYQAYLPVTAAVYVLWLFHINLSEEVTFLQVFKKGLLAVATMVLGLIVYFGINKLCLIQYGLELDAYQGINEMGKISLGEVPGLIVRTYRCYFRLPFDDYCDLATNDLLKLVYLVIYIVNIVLAVVVFAQKKKPLGNILMAVLLGAAFPVAVNLIEIMCPGSRIYSLMVFSCAISFFVPLVLLEQMPSPRKIVVKGVAVILLLFAMLNTYFNNLTYTMTYYVNRQAENYMVSLVTQVRMTKGFSTDKKWAFIGANADPMLKNEWNSAPRYGGADTIRRFLTAYSWQKWIPTYVGIQIPLANNDTVEAIKQTQEFQDMACWPNDDSIRIINNVIVVKFQEE